MDGIPLCEKRARLAITEKGLLGMMDPLTADKNWSSINNSSKELKLVRERSFDDNDSVKEPSENSLDEILEVLDVESSETTDIHATRPKHSSDDIIAIKAIIRSNTSKENNALSFTPKLFEVSKSVKKTVDGLAFVATTSSLTSRDSSSTHFLHYFDGKFAILTIDIVSP